MEVDPDARTALATAWVRAYHLQHDEPPHIFEDPFAQGMLEPHEREFFDALFVDQFLELDERGEPAGRTTRELLDGYMRTTAPPIEMLTRQRFGEEHLAHAIERGVEQYVLLGAGMD